ncbi:MAG: phosphate acyltransferase [Fidelibacterota bacterium]
MNKIKNFLENQQLFSSRIVFPEMNSIGCISAFDGVRANIDLISHEDYLTKINEYLEMALRLEFSKNWSVGVLERYLEAPLHLSMMMIKADDADHLIAGYSYEQDDIIRSAIRLIGLANHHRWVFSTSMLISAETDRKFTFSDCSVIPEPTPEQLCHIAGEAANCHKLLTGQMPIVAFISFSTHGSFSHYRVDKVIKAHSLFQKKFPNIQAMGEVQIKAAIHGTKDGLDGELFEEANVFVFPNLDAGNVAYQLSTSLAGFRSAGSIIHGLNKQITIISKNSEPDEIYYSMVNASKLKGENAYLQL